jgi:hypothetical protein
MSKKCIEFLPSCQLVRDVVPPPTPARKFIPQWYKNAPSDYLKNTRIMQGELKNTSLKQCMPFFDAFYLGYVQVTWSDIFIKNENGKISWFLASKPEVLGWRETKHVPTFDEVFYEKEFVWYQPFIPKTPKDYSVLVTHPLNRFDLPFVTLAGVMDSDGFHHSANGQIPFYVKHGFSGLIPKGTPMFQIIPFKREAWVSAVREFDSDAMDAKQRERHSVFWHFYKDRFWQRKSYE